MYIQFILMTTVLLGWRRAGQQLVSLRNFRGFSTAGIWRDHRLERVSDADIQFFESTLGAKNVLTEPHELLKYNT